MVTEVNFHEAFNPNNSPMPILSSCVRVEFVGYDAWTFKGNTRQAYNDAMRFVRLVQLGYAPAEAYHLSLNGEKTSLASFNCIFDPASHSEFWNELDEIAADLVDPADYMAKGEPTIEEISHLRQLWLDEGDEVFELEGDYGFDLSALLGQFRDEAQHEDENSTGDYISSHHREPIAY